MINSTDDIIALDYGSKRIGVARISPVVKIAEPLLTLDATAPDLYGQLKCLYDENDAQALVVGVPRGLSGQHTEQTQICIEFAKQVQKNTGYHVYCIDEAGTSKVAEQRMKHARNVDAGLDAFAAAVFAEDFCNHTDQQELLLANYTK